MPKSIPGNSSDLNQNFKLNDNVYIFIVKYKNDNIIIIFEIIIKKLFFFICHKPFIDKYGKNIKE